ncbi:MAG: DUF3574 domain-containing protein [Gemmatimonadetes bacterium]|nr:DUF3574 domain-containing protein [Gemmatimonadota bacterium]
MSAGRPAAPALLLGALLAGCAPPRALPAPAPAAQGQVDDRLFFGRSISGGGAVSDEEWRAFVEEVVAPRFPDGMTVWRAEGAWRGADGRTTREPTLVLEVVHPAGAAGDSAVAAIAREYRRRFRQEAVLRVAAPVRMELYR